MNSPDNSEDTPVALRLAQGEVKKRDVTLTSAKGPLGRVSSRIVITDARVIYLAEAKNKLGSSRHASEIQLNDVGAITHYVNRGLSGLALVAVPLLVLIGLITLLANPASSPIFFLIALVVFVVGRKAKTVTFDISSRSQGGVAISMAHQSGGPIRSAIVGVFSIFLTPIVRVIFPRLGIMDALSAPSVDSTDEAGELFLEIGAVVLDLQSRGSLGA